MSGDSAVFIGALSKLQGGYFERNLAAWAHAGEEAGFSHKRLGIEGGFPVMLYLARNLGERAPFLVAAVFTACMIFVCMWMAY